MRDLTEFQAKAVLISLNKLFSQGHYSISAVTEIAALLNVEINKNDPDFMALSLLHCVHYNTLDGEMVRWTRDTTIRILQLSPDYFATRVKTPAEKEETKASEGGWVHKLLGR